MADLFLSYHGPDRDAVLTIQGLVKARGLSTFLDRDDLVRGLPWPQALENALRTCRGVVVFVGAELGSWQWRELGFALDRQASEEKEGRHFPVIPVLLPRAAPGRSFLYLNTWVDLRADLDNARELDALVAAVATPSAPGSVPSRVASDICPYLGLHAFREEDAPFLYGREEAIDRLDEKVTTSRLAAVVGSSGCGKSSVVLAGLVPRLRRRRPPNVTWDVVSFTPGSAPLRRLARALVTWLEPERSPVDLIERSEELGGRFERDEQRPAAFVEEGLRLSGADRLLLVVDQFEELFTETPPEQRRPFADALVQLLQQCPLVPVLTLRADFFGPVIDLHRELSTLVEAGNVTLGPLQRDELRRTIVEPARRVGLTFDPPLLVEKLLDDVGDEPGNLPLLEYALTALWEERRDGKLLESTYARINGVAGAIAARADDEVTKLGQPEAVRRVMTRLVRTSPTTGGVENTRRRAVLSDLGETARAVVAEFSKPGVWLLVTGRDEAGRETVEVAHEVLIRAWARMREWLDSDLELRLWRQRLEPSLEYWNRDASNVLTGLMLAEAEKWGQERAGDLLRRERALIEARVRKRDEEVREAAERRERELVAARELAAASEARAQAQEAARVEAEARTEAENKARAEAESRARAARRYQRVLAALLGLVVVVLVLALAAGGWAFVSQRQTRAALDRVEQRLRLQVNSPDGELVLSALDQLSQDRSVAEALALVPTARLMSNEWMASVTEALDQAALREPALADDWFQLRTQLWEKLIATRGIEPPTEAEDKRLNPRIRLAGGRFQMGSPGGVGDSDETPAHRVTLSAFRIQEHEVTNAEYSRFDPTHAPDAPDDHPVVNVTWNDAMAYASWLGGSLPTEAQWEFAARGAEGRTYPWGEALPTCERANFGICPGLTTAVKVDREAGRTPEGVYDLAGNVWEWCRDRYGPYSAEAQTNPLGPSNGSARVLRGGSFDRSPDRLRGAYRDNGDPVYRGDNYGFRVVWWSAGGLD